MTEGPCRTIYTYPLANQRVCLLPGSRPARRSTGSRTARRVLVSALAISFIGAGAVATHAHAKVIADPMLALSRDGAFLVATWTQPVAGAASIAIETAPGVVPPGPHINPIPLPAGQVELQVMPLAHFSPLMARGERRTLRLVVPERSGSGARRVRVVFFDMGRRAFTSRTVLLSRVAQDRRSSV